MNTEAKERMLLTILRQLPDSNGRAVMLQSYIQEEGPLTEETAAKVREILKNASQR